MNKHKAHMDWDVPLFVNDYSEDEPEPRRDGTRWKILVVDDDEDMVAVTRLVLSSFRYEGVPIQILSAYCYQQAVELLQQHPDIAMAFIDVVMETDHSGLDLVHYIRDSMENKDIQLVLRTGQPGYAPEMEVILEYEINDYRLKTELDNVKLVTTVVSSLRNYKNIMVARESSHNEALTAEISKAKSLFFAQMSHDLRTPLNSILGFCQLLQLHDLGKEQLEQVAMIQRSGQQLLAIVNDILDFSKGEAGKIVLKPVRFSLPELIEATARLIEPQVPPQIEFSLVGVEALPKHLYGDPPRIQQILQNLLINAIRFTEQGFVRLTIEAKAQPDHKWLLCFTVSDSGIGISKQRVGQLFTAYEQASQQTKEAGGTGLGLVICKQLVELMGGGISVTSKPGQGSSFRVEIRLPEQAPLDAATTTIAPTLVPQVFRSGDAKARVLVVDDDISNRLVARKMLERLGYRVDCAEGGRQALSLAANFNYNLIFMDCDMPMMNGYDCTRQIRRLDSYDNIPVVALTGAELRSEMESCFEAGMTDYLQKPIHLDRLRELTHKWLGKPKKAP